MTIVIYARDKHWVEGFFLRDNYSLENILYKMNIVEK